MDTRWFVRDHGFFGINALILLLILLCSASITLAADSITATKSKLPGGSYDVGGTTTFTIVTGQEIEWEATYTDTTPPAGNDFYLHRPGQPLDEIPLSTNLTGFDSGTHFLAAGTYEISVTYFGMGAGHYTINYNRTAAIEVTPSNHPFGDVFTGDSTSSTTFTVSSAGDLPVTINNVTVNDSAHFEITGDPSGQTVPPNRDFQVRCLGGVSDGSFPGTITVSGTSDIGPVSDTATVSCNVLPREPDIHCPGTPSLGSADWFLGETLTENRSFSNEGSDDLVLTDINVVNDTTAGVFDLNGTPSSSAVSPGHSRDVSIDFTPPESGGELTYDGHLVINSNDPDEPVKTCPFTARAHHPVPVMRLESTTLDYRDVELGFTFTQAVVVHNDGDAALNINLADISDGDPDLVHFNLDTGAATVNPGDAPAVFRQECSPRAEGGPYIIQMQVTGNDLTNPSQNVTLVCSGVLPVPIDSVLILDRSGSMNDSAGVRRKIDALQVAADLFTHLLRPDIAGTGDKLGFVRYNQNNDVYMPLDFVEATATPGSHLADAEEKLSDAAITDINRLRPDGDTGIGGAMQTGAGVLIVSPTERKHVMVVLTDGRENELPWISEVIGPITTADPELMIYSVGLGSNIQADRLQAITNIANGYHQVGDDLSGTSIFDLENFYFKIFVNATEMDLVVDPTYIASLSGNTPVPLGWAYINSSDRSATFLVLDFPALRPFYDLELVDPHDNVMVLGSSVGGVPVHVLQRHNYTLYRVVFPAVEQAASYVGDWTLRLTPNGEWNEVTIDELRKQLSVAKGTGMVVYDPGQGVVPIGFAAAVSSDYHMQVQVLPSNYLPGAEVTLTAALSDRGWPMTTGEVEVDVTTPGGTRYDNLRLFDDGTHGDLSAADGTWTGRFINTAEAGSYRFFFDAIGENERGELAPRQATRYATLQALTPDPDEEPCIPCNLQWLLWVVALLLLLLLWYCCCWRKYRYAG